ncbi:CaiB/BaiF CoA transferase family protein [Thermodesulfobacteriota bacterium]
MTLLPSALEGIDVLDFTWAGAGPFSTRCLAEYGARVIKVETRKRPDIGRLIPPFKDNINHPDRNLLFLHANTSKLGITLNMTHPKGKEIASKLASKVDIVIENFTPGVIGRLGLGYDDLKKIKPDIILVSSSIRGQTGPKSKFSGFGNAGAAISGHHMLTGWPDREPVPPGFVYADVVQPVFTTIAVMAALDYRRRTGKGQYIDTTQVETMIQLISPAILDYFANGRIQKPNGNRSSYACPHAVFPCRGDERWCTIAVFNEKEWQALCKVMDYPEWTSDGKFKTLDSRKANEDELESLISRWTINYERDDLANLLWKAGITSGPVQGGEDLVDKDPQLRTRESFKLLSHPFIGECNHPTQPVRLSKSPAQTRTSPCLGEHNKYVYTEFLGIPPEEYEELLKEGVFE